MFLFILSVRVHALYCINVFVCYIHAFTIINYILMQFFSSFFHPIPLSRVPVDPLEWQISQDTANSIFACLANTIGAAESVLRVAATGHDKRLFFKVDRSVCLYIIYSSPFLFSSLWGIHTTVILFHFREKNDSAHSLLTRKQVQLCGRLRFFTPMSSLSSKEKDILKCQFGIFIESNY